MDSLSAEHPKEKNNISQRKRIGFKAVVRFVLFLVFLPLILFGTAGRLDWPMAWAFVGLYFGSVFVSRLIVMIKFPELLLERARFLASEGTKRWEIVLVPLIALLGPLATLVVAGLDRRLGWSPHISFSVQLAGLVLVVIGMSFGIWAMGTNKFFSSVVRIQRDRGHIVVTGGPYRFVRHPAYVGGILFQLAIPIMLGSLWALIPAVLVAAGYIVRTLLEDKVLRSELSGYSEYAHQTRHRLIPGVW